MNSEEKNEAQVRLSNAFDSFSVLINSKDLFPIHEVLSMSSAIRDHVVNNVDITNCCNDDEKFSEERKQLLDQIQEFQLGIIVNTVKDTIDIDTDKSVIIPNYSDSNKALFDLSKKELEKCSCFSLSNSIKESKEHSATLTRIVGRGLKDEFRILLMGEYQSGKTTLVDAIIGKHIGAIGDGNTTSAVPIELSYGDNNHVHYQLKNKDSIRTLLSLTKKYIQDFSLDSFNIDNADEREELYQIINTFRHDSNCPKAKEPGLKILAISSLILKYYGDYRLASMTCDSSDLMLIPFFTRFPKRFEARWRRKGGDDFSFEESMFAFIDSVHCSLQSERLHQLNCTIVDSPGLFSNEYDTRVTEREMLNANAILYVLPYEKEVGEDSCGSLYVLQNNYKDYLRKLFIVNNRSFCDHKHFYKDNLENIKEMFGPSMQLYKTDARLAYLGVVKKAFDKGELSEDEIIRFILSCQYESADEDDIVGNATTTSIGFIDAWDSCIVPYRLRYRWTGRPSADELIEKSNLNNVLTELLSFIEHNRAYSIIASEGIFKLYHELIAIRKSLKLRYVQPQISGRELLESTWTERISKVSLFETKARQVIEKYLFTQIGQQASLCDKLSEMAYDSVFTEDSLDRMIISICKEIYSNKRALAKCGRDEQKIKEFISPKIENIISGFIEERVNDWNSRIQTQQELSFSDAFTKQILLIERELDLEWKAMFPKGKEELDDFETSRSIYYDVSKDTSDFSIGSSHSSGQGFTTGSVSLTGSILNELAVAIAGIVSTILLFLLPTILAIIGNPLSWTVVGVVALFGAGYYAMTGDDWMEQKFIDKNAPKIKEKMSEQNLNGKLRGFIHNEIELLLKSYVQSVNINRIRLNDDRDIALSTPQEEIEQCCFTAVKEIITIDERLSSYKEFCEQYLVYAED